MVLISLVSVLNLLYFYISTFRSMCAVPNMVVFCSSLTSWFPGTLLTYFLNVFELLLLLLLLLLTAIELSPSGSGYLTCIQNMKLVTNKFKSGGLHEKHVVARRRSKRVKEVSKRNEQETKQKL